MEKKSARTVRIAVTGPECTGKTHLCKALAEHYKSIWVPEYAREYLGNLGRKYAYEDLSEIARGHLEQERLITAQARAEGLPLVLTDTELINIKIWSEFWYRKSEPWITDEIAKADYDHYFLMSPDIPWEPDQLRENPDDRDKLFEWFRKELQTFGKPFSVLSGSYEERIQQAIRFVEQLKHDA